MRSSTIALTAACLLFAAPALAQTARGGTGDDSTASQSTGRSSADTDTSGAARADQATPNSAEAGNTTAQASETPKGATPKGSDTAQEEYSKGDSGVTASSRRSSTKMARNTRRRHHHMTSDAGTGANSDQPSRGTSTQPESNGGGAGSTVQ